MSTDMTGNKGPTRYLPPLHGWEADKHAPLKDLLDELQAMDGKPVDLEISKRENADSSLWIRDTLAVEEFPLDGRSPERCLQLSASQVQLRLISSEFAGAYVCPGYVKALYGTLKIEVGRVELMYWRQQQPAV